MKQTGSILFLFVFCLYSFVFKTHYCYYINTDVRFHGDCNHEILSAKEKGSYADINFFPNHYHCDDYYKDARPAPAKAFTVKCFTDIVAVINTNLSTSFYHDTIIDWIFPEIQTRGAPSLLPNCFRGPPLV